MADYSDQEQVDKLKAWWKTYGNALITGILLGAVLLGGNKYWTQYKERQSYEASVLYERVLAATRESDRDAAQTIVSRLMDDYTRTPYAGLGALLLAKVYYDAGDLDSAREKLRWAERNAKDSSTMHTARLRLARIMADQGDLDGALALIDVQETTGFESEYHELRGDLLLIKGLEQEAREAYKAALQSLSPSHPYRRFIQMKLDDLGAESSQ